MPKQVWAGARDRAKRQLAQMAAAEDAGLTRAALDDSHNPPLADEFWERVRPAADVEPALVEKALRRRGRPKAEETKVPVTLRLDRGVVAALRAEGPGWQTRLNDMLVKRVRRGRKIA